MNIVHISKTIINTLLSEEPFTQDGDAFEDEASNNIKQVMGNVLKLEDGTEFMVIARPVKIHTCLHSVSLGQMGYQFDKQIDHTDLIMAGIDPDTLNSNKDGIEIEGLGAIYCRWDGKYQRWIKKTV